MKFTLGHHQKICSSVQSLSCVQLFVTPQTAARQASLSIANSQSLLKLMSLELVMPSNHLILCRPFLLPASIFPSIRVFSNESVLHIRWPKYWSFSFSISAIPQFKSIKSSALSFLYGPIFTSIHRFSSVTQSCLTLCNPMDCSMPGLSVHQQLLEITQTHVH